MLHDYTVDIAFFFMRHLRKVAMAKRGTIVIGGFLTPIALHLGIEPYGIEVARGNSRIDIESCIAMKMIVRDRDTYCLSFQPGLPTLPLPNPERTSVQNLENWKLSPDCVSFATPAPETSVPPPPPTWSSDPFGIGTDFSPPETSEPPPHGAAGSSSQHAPRDGQGYRDPGFQTIAAQMYRQEQRMERVLGGIGRLHEQVSHIHLDVEALGNYVEDMGNFLYDRFGYEDPRRGGIYGDAGEGAFPDPAAAAPAGEDDEETHSDE